MKLILRNKFIVFLSVVAVLTGYCFYVEPNWIQTNTIQIETKLNRNYKFVQISDVHMKVMTFKEHWILKKVEFQKPDAIFVTGDLVSGESAMGTIRLLLTKPVSRSTILFSKYIFEITGN